MSRVLYLCQSVNLDCFGSDNLVVGPAKSGTLKSFVNDCSGSSPIPDDGLVSNAKWIKFNGWEYRRHSVALLTPSSDTKDGLPEFGKISNFLVHHGSPFFVITIMITDNFNFHFHSFEVWSPETEVKVLKGFYELAEGEPLWLL
jgi:hypothetical protein